METIIIISVLSTLGVVALVTAIVVAFRMLKQKVDVTDYNSTISEVSMSAEIERKNIKMSRTHIAPPVKTVFYSHLQFLSCITVQSPFAPSAPVYAAGSHTTPANAQNKAKERTLHPQGFSTFYSTLSLKNDYL